MHRPLARLPRIFFAFSDWAKTPIQPADTFSVRSPVEPRETKQGRKGPRFRCCGTIEIHIGGWRPYPGRICNLSLQGCLIKPIHGSDCAVGEHIELRFQVNGLSFLTECVVRAVHPGGDLGVEILRVGTRGSQQLLELMQELEESSASS